MFWIKNQFWEWFKSWQGWNLKKTSRFTKIEILKCDSNHILPWLELVLQNILELFLCCHDLNHSTHDSIHRTLIWIKNCLIWIRNWLHILGLGSINVIWNRDFDDSNHVTRIIETMTQISELVFCYLLDIDSNQFISWLDLYSLLKTRIKHPFYLIFVLDFHHI